VKQGWEAEYMKCKYCDGKGYTFIMLNPKGYYYNGDEPITDKVPCEECGGTGEATGESLKGNDNDG